MRDLTEAEIETVSGGDLSRFENWVTVWSAPGAEGYETQEWQNNFDGSVSAVFTWHSGAIPGQDVVLSNLNGFGGGSEVFTWGSGDISVDFPGGVSANIATIRPSRLFNRRPPTVVPSSTPGHPNGTGSAYLTRYHRGNAFFSQP